MFPHNIRSYLAKGLRRFSTVVPQPTQDRNTVCLYKHIDAHVPYKIAHDWMSDLVERKGRVENNEPRDVLFIVQHSPVYTLGKAATADNVKFPLGPDCPFEVHNIERGGEVTYHGPGQLTVYPILNLKKYKKDLHWYVSQLESVVIELLANKYNIKAGIDPANPGVWIGDAKIAALGCKFSRWVTMHGFALNVTLECLQGFNRIVPCGIQDKQVVAIEHFHQPVTLEQVSQDIIESFQKVFNVDIVVDQELQYQYDHDLAMHTYRQDNNLEL